ncbi:Por secretion system C-terminal sorting domain-containing protein [Bizionia echini]|uniref:Por secretion system C-terminal sorting domain-containing protein n=1 Tax=Bizionia echini TaxID=649333 RepID=A0A1I4ZNK5_9FLAO|nr:T9SS type A sorting domain-containing protein [Bizionia echini]SFN51560.1 Por secretion system C-terminal sorting domain-containing protein [Bizionia echini]
MKTITRHALIPKHLLLLAMFVMMGQFAMAQKPMEKRSIEISLEAEEYIPTEIKNNGRFNSETGVPVALYGLNYEVPQGSPESMALYYLDKESKTLGIPKEELQNLKHHATRTSNAGSVVRFRQYAGAYPVNKNEVTISISPQNKVVFVMNSFEAGVNMANVQPSISKDNAYTRALNYLNVQSDISFNDSRLMVYKNTKITRLAHEVIISSTNPLGEWHVFVDARTGEIFKVVDMNHYYCGDDGEHDENCNHDKSTTERNEYRRRVNGTGMVFNPDPLTSNMATYGATGYVDGGDANTAQLTAARFSVTLNDITQTGSTYSLVGPRAEIIDFDAPTTGLFSQNSSDFSFTRQDQGFEAVNTYFHIDYMMDYLNNTLGLTIEPYQYSGGVRYDPHGAGGADNSYYQPAAGRLSFGEGCVDDAEDSDVIHHELGHGLHDWVTAGANSGAEGLGEGTGDYVAQSYNRGVNNANGYWTAADPQYNWVFNWDGHNACWNGRVTNYTASYPGGLTGSIHTDGQIWASCLMGIWDQIGQQEMDIIFWEGLGMTGGTTGQNDAAVAVYQAAVNLNYSTSDINIIHSSLTSCGYTLPALPGPPVAAFSADNETICLDTNNTVNFSDETVPNATSWLWTFEGGSPATSTAQNPTVTYAADGMYDVTLVATNSFGTNTLVLTDYISVVSGAACPACSSLTNNTEIPISDGAGGQTYTSIITATAGILEDVNVTIDITHTWNADLDITLTSPAGTVVELTSDNGGVAGQNYTATVFDQEAGASITTGSSPFTGTFIPEGDLSTLYGEDAAGDWILTVTDDATQDGGQINYWSIELCFEPTASVEEFDIASFAIFPNPNNGSFNIKLQSDSDKGINVQVYDIRGRTIFNNSFTSSTDFNQEINLENAQSGVYLVKVSNGLKETIKKIVIK